MTHRCLETTFRAESMRVETSKSENAPRKAQNGANTDDLRSASLRHERIRDANACGRKAIESLKRHQIGQAARKMMQNDPVFHLLVGETVSDGTACGLAQPRSANQFKHSSVYRPISEWNQIKGSELRTDEFP